MFRPRALRLNSNVVAQLDQQVAAVPFYRLTRATSRWTTCLSPSLREQWSSFITYKMHWYKLYVLPCVHPWRSCDWNGSCHWKKKPQYGFVMGPCRLPDPWGHQPGVRGRQEHKLTTSPFYTLLLLLLPSGQIALCGSAPRKASV